MNGKYELPCDSFGGRYGYYGIVIQKGGIRLDCLGPFVPVSTYRDIYKTLRNEQKKIIRKKPKTLRAAYRLSGKCLWRGL